MQTAFSPVLRLLTRLPTRSIALGPRSFLGEHPTSGEQWSEWLFDAPFARLKETPRHTPRQDTLAKGAGLATSDCSHRFAFAFFLTFSRSQGASSGDGPTFLSSFRWLITSSWLNLFCIFIPLGIVAEKLQWDAVWIFSLNFLAIVPLAKVSFQHVNGKEGRSSNSLFITASHDACLPSLSLAPW